LRFTVRRLPNGEVSLCWYRPSGGDVARCVDVGVARPRIAGDADKDRLALAVFGCDMPAGGASLRRVRGRDPFDSSRGLMVEPGNQPAPPLTHDCAVEASFLRDANSRSIRCAACRAGHCPRVQRLDSNRVESARKVGGGLFDPVPPPVRLARIESGDCKLGAMAAVGAALGAREALLQSPQPNQLTGLKARGVQQLACRQCRRHRNTSIDTDDTAIVRSRNRFGDMRESNIPAAGPILPDAIRLHACGYRPRPTEANPTDLRHPHPPAAPVELFDMVWLDPDLPEAFVHAGFAPRRAPMSANKEVPLGVREVAQGLLLHRLRPGRQPTVFGANHGQLRGLLVVPRGATTRLPKLLLLHRQVPNKSGMPAMLQQRQLLKRRRQQPKPRHIRNVVATTDTGSRRKITGITVRSEQKYRGFPQRVFA